MKIEIEMNLDDFDFLLKRFNLKEEFKQMFTTVIQSGVSIDNEVMKDIRRNFVDKQFMKKIDDIFGDCHVRLILREDDWK